MNRFLLIAMRFLCHMREYYETRNIYPKNQASLVFQKRQGEENLKIKDEKYGKK
jgi:hypothetical protein